MQKRFTVIFDNSGTGKTTFVELIGRYANKDAFLKCDLPCSVLPLTALEGKWEAYFNEEAVVVIDEAHPIYDLDYFEIFKNAKCYIVMINREMPALIYGLSNIYRLKTIEGYHYLEPYYNFAVKLYRKPNLVICEDSGSSFEFCRPPALGC